MKRTKLASARSLPPSTVFKEAAPEGSPVQKRVCHKCDVDLPEHVLDMEAVVCQLQGLFAHALLQRLRAHE
eukprot:2044909-Amphidinium_carterae.1